MAFHVPNRWRVTHGEYATNGTAGNNGHFRFRIPSARTVLAAATDTNGWEHVSFSIVEGRGSPAFVEVRYIKRLFWDLGDVVCILYDNPIITCPEYDSYHKPHHHQSDEYRLWRPIYDNFPSPLADLPALNERSLWPLGGDRGISRPK
jgi:hypothetical protein